MVPSGTNEKNSRMVDKIKTIVEVVEEIWGSIEAEPNIA